MLNREKPTYQLAQTLIKDRANFRMLLVGHQQKPTLKTFKSRYDLQKRSLEDCYNEFIGIYNTELKYHFNLVPDFDVNIKPDIEEDGLTYWLHSKHFAGVYNADESLKPIKDHYVINYLIEEGQNIGEPEQVCIDNKIPYTKETEDDNVFLMVNKQYFKINN